jgi:tartrate/fumarate subfamily iron-sulfur-dependent hydro-lyase alpha chain
MLPAFFESVVDLITRTSTDLPPDVRAAMDQALGAEEPGTRAGQAITIIAQNIEQAASCEGPICQDTGMPTFEVKVPIGADQIWMRRQIREAVAEATRRGKLRPNSVDSITGENTGDNLGPGTPIIHFDQWEEPGIEIKLILKGGGCENTNAQYSLPTELDHLGRADRSLEGVRKCILHAVWKAQGKGCSPASAVIGRRGTPSPRSSSFERWTIGIRMHVSLFSKTRSWRRPIGCPSARWASAGRHPSSAARSARAIASPRAFSFRSRTTAGRFAGSASSSTPGVAPSNPGSIAIRQRRRVRC